MDEQQTQSIIAAVIAFLGGGGLIGLITLWANRKKNGAEALLIKANADHVVIGSALDFVKAIREEAADLRVRALVQEKRAEELEDKINILEDNMHLQFILIRSLKKALAEYNPEHPLLKETEPPKPPL